MYHRGPHDCLAHTVGMDEMRMDHGGEVEVATNLCETDNEEPLRMRIGPSRFAGPGDGEVEGVMDEERRSQVDD